MHEHGLMAYCRRLLQELLSADHACKFKNWILRTPVVLFHMITYYIPKFFNFTHAIQL